MRPENRASWSEFRPRLEDAVECLIAVLDAMDGDADHEGEEREHDAAEAGISDLDGAWEQLGAAC